MVDERTIELIREKLEKHEICLTEYGVRLMKVEDNAKEIKELAMSVKEIAITQKNMGSNFDEKFETLTNSIVSITNDVKSITDEPRKAWSTLKTSIISAVGGSVSTAIIGLLAYAIYSAK